MSGVAVAIGGAALLGYVGSQQQAGAARDAAAMQSSAADRANEVQRYMYDTTRADQAPWREVGVRSLSGLGNDDFMRDFSMKDFQNDPGYQFRLNEGMKALDRSAAARGGIASGRSMKDIARFSQDLASQEFQNSYNRFNSDRDRRFNRLASLAGIGQTATGQTAQAGMNYANATGQNMMGAANAQAAGLVGSANANASNLSNLGNLGMQYAMFNRMYPAPNSAVVTGGTSTAAL